MAHLLTTAGVLVSRFSTVPFEAMARGVPFVYHNPHGEKVPTFTQPHGAFDITTSSDGLANALGSLDSAGANHRERSEAFFRAQISIEETPAFIRAADAIVTLADL